MTFEPREMRDKRYNYLLLMRRFGLIWVGLETVKTAHYQQLLSSLTTIIRGNYRGYVLEKQSVCVLMVDGIEIENNKQIKYYLTKIAVILF